MKDMIKVSGIWRWSCSPFTNTDIYIMSYFWMLRVNFNSVWPSLHVREDLMNEYDTKVTGWSSVTDRASENGLWVHCWHGFFLLCCSHSVKHFNLLPGILPHDPALVLHITPNNTENLIKPNQRLHFTSHICLYSCCFDPVSSVWTSVLLLLCGFPCWHLLLHPKVKMRMWS